ncbi:M20 family metallopeptidase [candidate division KSB1 bacterium]|nr:M20 family metallopeptidase [candidate division KSB1 bacterium]
MSVITLTQDLVRINSVTPQAESDVARQGGEERLALWLRDFFSDRDFHCELNYVESGRPNLVARPSFYDSFLPTVVFTAHLDTVDVQDMPAPFAADIRDGHLYGRGACDVKGTLAAMAVSLVEWCAQQSQPVFNPVFIATMGEEAGTLGAKWLAKQGWKFDAVLVGEPTCLQPVVAHKGLWRAAITTHGISCHSSRPELGKNAVDGMVQLIGSLRQRFVPEFVGISGNTFSLTTIHGGTLINMIPDSCRIEIDMRFDARTPIEKLRAVLREQVRNSDFEAELNELQCDPGFRRRTDSLLFRMVARAMADEGLTIEEKEEPWYSDAGHFSAAGFDTLLWGAGDIRYAHTRDERIAVTELEKAVSVLKRVLYNFQGHYESAKR